MFAIYPYETYSNSMCNRGSFYGNVGCRGQSIHPFDVFNPFEDLITVRRPVFTVSAPVRRPRPVVQRRITITSRTSPQGAILSITLPGFNKQLIDIQVLEDNLSISAQFPDGSSRTFQKTFELDEAIDRDSISASFENDILTIKLPFVVKKKPEVRRIPVMGAEPSTSTPPAPAIAHTTVDVDQKTEQVVVEKQQDQTNDPSTTPNNDKAENDDDSDAVLVEKTEEEKHVDDDVDNESVDGSIEECEY